jgi:hypothetical protein
MMEDPEFIRLNAPHYRLLLTLRSTTDTRDRVIKLLGEALESWPGESGQGEKGIFCLRAAKIAAD